MAEGPDRLRHARRGRARSTTWPAASETTIRELAELINELTGNPTPIALTPGARLGPLRASATGRPRRRAASSASRPGRRCARASSARSSGRARTSTGSSAAWRGTRSACRSYGQRSSGTSPSPGRRGCRSARNAGTAEPLASKAPAATAAAGASPRWRAALPTSWPTSDSDESTSSRAYTRALRADRRRTTSTAPIQGDELLALEAERLLEAVRPCAPARRSATSASAGASLFERLRAERPRLLVGVDLACALPTAGRLRSRPASSLVLRQRREPALSRGARRRSLPPTCSSTCSTRRLPRSAPPRRCVPGGRLVLKVPYRENMSQYRRAGGCPYPMVHLRTFDRGAAAPGARGCAAARRGASATPASTSDRWQPPIGRLAEGGRRLLHRAA